MFILCQKDSVPENEGCCSTPVHEFLLFYFLVAPRQFYCLKSPCFVLFYNEDGHVQFSLDYWFSPPTNHLDGHLYTLLNSVSLVQ